MAWESEIPAAAAKEQPVASLPPDPLLLLLYGRKQHRGASEEGKVDHSFRPAGPNLDPLHLPDQAL